MISLIHYMLNTISLIYNMLSAISLEHSILNAVVETSNISCISYRHTQHAKCYESQSQRAKYY